MIQAVRHLGISVEEYLAGEKIAELRHEYINGRVFAMVGTSRAHNIIAGNLYGLLRRHLKGGPFQVYMSDVKVRIRNAADERFYYPDLFVDCVVGEGDRYFSEAPKLVVEVLSDSTERADRAEKLYAYRSLATVEEYLLVAQDRPRVELYRRSEGWTPRVWDGGALLSLDSVGLSLSLVDLYEAVPLETD